MLTAKKMGARRPTLLERQQHLVIVKKWWGTKNT